MKCGEGTWAKEGVCVGEEQGETGGETATDTGNRPPEGSPVVLIMPAEPNRHEDLLCYISEGATDPEGDVVSYSFAWSVDGAQAEEVGPVVSAESTLPYQEWTCTVTATDGVGEGESGSATVTIGNTPPGPPEVEISPSSPGPDDDLECLVSTESQDAEGDEVSYSYLWNIDGVDSAITDPQVGSADTLTGEVWTCTVTPSDGLETGESGSASVTVTEESGQG